MQDRNFDMLTFASLDEDTCPAECVTEVFTPQEFKKACEVQPPLRFVLIAEQLRCCACLQCSPCTLAAVTCACAHHTARAHSLHHPTLQALPARLPAVSQCSGGPQHGAGGSQDAGSALVMVDFYKTSCGACKYLLPGFMKLCKAAYDRDVHPAVVFLKHNVFDDYEEEKTDLARRLQIQVRQWPQATCCLHAHL